jgi:hypothetical protein
VHLEWGSVVTRLAAARLQGIALPTAFLQLTFQTYFFCYHTKLLSFVDSFTSDQSLAYQLFMVLAAWLRDHGCHVHAVITTHLERHIWKIAVKDPRYRSSHRL